MHQLLILPMAFYYFFIFALAIRMFFVRKGAIKSGELKLKYYQTYASADVPERVLVAGRNFDNHFQVPIIFLITCTVFLAVAKANDFTLVLAWGFVASRIAHSYVHLGRNRILPRALTFFTGMLILLVMWAQLVCLVAFTE